MVFQINLSPLERYTLGTQWISETRINMDYLCRVLTPVVILLFLTPAVVTNAGADIDAAMQAQIRSAVAHGLDWIGQHPASLQDGGLPDLLDEGVGFMMLSTLSTDPGARERFAARFRERMVSLGEMPEFA